MLRKPMGGLKATVGNRVKPDYHFISIVFTFFFSFRPDSCVPWQVMLKNMSAHWTHGPKPS